MKYQNYKITIARVTSVQDTLTYEGNVKLVSPNDHHIHSANFSIKVTWEEYEQMAAEPKKHSMTFYNVDDFDKWINQIINSCDRCNGNFRQFVKWLENRLEEAKALQVLK